MTHKPVAKISGITFSDGNYFGFSPNDKVIMVGPNNSGKSLSLREIFRISSEGDKANTLAVKDVGINKKGSKEELKFFLDEKASLREDHYYYKDWVLSENAIRRWDEPYLIRNLASGFMKNIEAIDRLSICDVQDSIGPTEQKSKPQHLLYDDPVLMSNVSALFRRSFGEDIMFDFRGGSKLPIHVGELPDRSGRVDRVGNEYVSAVRSNPLLHEQGDGMKSYAGILFEAIVANRDITLIDEPEAFLHPPQMRQLGQMLASEMQGQLIAATHSSDILRGFLEGTNGNLRILRIRREEEKNMVNEAEPNVIRKLWEDPQLRYSNALEGIFHEQAIICEDDSDCRLMNSVADHIAASRKQPWKDTAYVPVGGKHRIPDVASVLRNIGVPVKAVFDIDFLSEKNLVEKSVLAFGGDWDEFEPYWHRVDTAVRNGVQSKSIPEIKESIVRLLKNSNLDELPKGDVIETMKQNKPWNIVKRFGVSGLPSGNAQNDYGILKDKLEGIGVYLVPVGEIENFCREIGLHGPKFVTRLLSEKSLADEDLAELRKFVETVHLGPHGRWVEPLNNEAI